MYIYTLSIFGPCTQSLPLQNIGERGFLFYKNFTNYYTNYVEG